MAPLCKWSQSFRHYLICIEKRNKLFSDSIICFKMIMNSIKIVLSILTKGLLFQLVTVLFLKPGLVLKAPDVKAGKIILLILILILPIVRKMWFDFFQSSVVSSLCSDTNIVVCQADR